MNRQSWQDRFSGVVECKKKNQEYEPRTHSLTPIGGSSFYMYGLRNRERHFFNCNDTILNGVNLNKMVTALAIAQLEEHGKLKFSGFLRDYLPNYPQRDVAQRVTIHQLLTHTSGLAEFPIMNFFSA